MLRSLSRVRVCPKFQPKLKNMSTETVEEVKANENKKDVNRYLLMGFILGGVGTGVPLGYLYLFEKYELQWFKRMHDVDGNQKPE